MIITRSDHSGLKPVILIHGLVWLGKHYACAIGKTVLDWRINIGPLTKVEAASCPEDAESKNIVERRIFYAGASQKKRG